MCRKILSWLWNQCPAYCLHWLKEGSADKADVSVQHPKTFMAPTIKTQRKSRLTMKWSSHHHLLTLWCQQSSIGRFVTNTTPPQGFSFRAPKNPWPWRLTKMPGVVLNKKRGGQTGFCKWADQRWERRICPLQLMAVSPACCILVASPCGWPKSPPCLTRGMLQRDTLQFSTRWTNTIQLSAGRWPPGDKMPRLACTHQEVFRQDVPRPP